MSFFISFKKYNFSLWGCYTHTLLWIFNGCCWRYILMFSTLFLFIVDINTHQGGRGQLWVAYYAGHQSFIITFFLFVSLTTLETFIEFWLVWFRCSLIYRPLSYPFRSLYTNSRKKVLDVDSGMHSFPLYKGFKEGVLLNYSTEFKK